MPAARPSQAQIANALAAWQAAGLTVGRMTIDNGKIIIEVPPPIERIEISAQAAGPKQWKKAG
jgi:hypothetical protein